MAAYSPVVVVTGSSEGGIGYALCESFAARGCTVYATARRLEATQGLASLSNPRGTVHPTVLDVDDAENCEEVIQKIIAEAGRIDILVNNAGAAATGPLLDFSIEKAKKVMDTNVFATLRLAQLVAPHQHKYFQKTGRRGLIANVGSIVGDLPVPWAGIYATSKAAVHALTNILRLETKGLGIDVMLIAPGAVSSNFGNKHIATIDGPPASLYHSMKEVLEWRATAGQVGATPNRVFAAGVVSAALRPQRSILNPLAIIFGTGPPAYYSAGGRWFQFWPMSFFPTKLKFFVLYMAASCYKVGKK